jgi:uncharacterized NAD-dependent epimerase/dehydratase family protein
MEVGKTNENLNAKRQNIKLTSSAVNAHAATVPVIWIAFSKDMYKEEYVEYVLGAVLFGSLKWTKKQQYKFTVISTKHKAECRRT